MKFLSSVAVAILAASQAVAQSLTISTPINPTTCMPVSITLIGGTPPYFLIQDNSLVLADQPGASPILDFGLVQQSGSMIWQVNIAADPSVNFNFRVLDTTGLVAQTAPFSIITADTSCVVQTISATAGPTSVPIPTTPTNTPTPTTSGDTTTSRSTTSRSTTSRSTTTSGGTTTSDQTTRPVVTSSPFPITGALTHTPTGAAAHRVGPVGGGGAFVVAIIAALV